MSAFMWTIIGIVGFVLAAILLVVAVVLFIRWRIPAVVGDLSGQTAKRQVKKMRQASADAAQKVNFVPGAKAPDVATAPRVIPTQPATSVAKTGSTATGSLETEILGGMGRTGTMPLQDANATTMLDGGATERLEPEGAAQPMEEVAFRLVKNVLVVHTSEVIE